MFEGYSRAIDLLSNDLAPLKDSEMFEDTEVRSLAEIKTGLDDYIAALKWKRANLDPNSPERIEQDANFRGTLTQSSPRF